MIVLISMNLEKIKFRISMIENCFEIYYEIICCVFYDTICHNLFYLNKTYIQIAFKTFFTPQNSLIFSQDIMQLVVQVAKQYFDIVRLNEKH